MTAYYRFPNTVTGVSERWLAPELPSETNVLIKRLEEVEAKLQRLLFFTSDMNVNLENVTARVIALEHMLQEISEEK